MSKFQAPCKAVVGQLFAHQEGYSVEECKGSDHGISDPPIRAADANRTSHLTAAIEVVKDVDVPDWRLLAENVGTMDAPFNTPMESNVQFYSKIQDDSKITLIKLLSFGVCANLKMLKDECMGDIFSLVKVPKTAPRILQSVIHYIGMRLGGKAVTNMTLEPPKRKTKGAVELQAIPHSDIMEKRV